MRLRRILLVDDNPRDVEMALDALAQYNVGNEAVTMHDGEEALEYLFRTGRFESRDGGDPAVILLDLKMPKVNGLEVLKRVKSDPGLRTIPVVMMTSSREEQDVVRSYDLGVNAYIVKPLEFHEFVDAIKVLGAFWVVLNEPPK